MVEIYVTRDYPLGKKRMEWTDGESIFTGTQEEARDYYRNKYPSKTMTLYKFTKKRR